MIWGLYSSKGQGKGPVTGIGGRGSYTEDALRGAMTFGQETQSIAGKFKGRNLEYKYTDLTLFLGSPTGQTQQEGRGPGGVLMRCIQLSFLGTDEGGEWWRSDRSARAKAQSMVHSGNREKQLAKAEGVGIGNHA